MTGQRLDGRIGANDRLTYLGTCVHGFNGGTYGFRYRSL